AEAGDGRACLYGLADGLPGSQVPELQVRGVAPCDGPTIVQNHQGPNVGHLDAVAAPIELRGVPGLQPARLLPALPVTAAGRRHESDAVGQERDSADRLVMLDGARFATGYGPKAGMRIVAAGQQQGAIVADIHRPNGTAVLQRRRAGLASTDVPDSCL